MYSLTVQLRANAPACDGHEQAKVVFVGRTTPHQQVQPGRRLPHHRRRSVPRRKRLYYFVFSIFSGSVALALHLDPVRPVEDRREGRVQRQLSGQHRESQDQEEQLQIHLLRWLTSRIALAAGLIIELD